MMSETLHALIADSIRLHESAVQNHLAHITTEHAEPERHELLLRRVVHASFARTAAETGSLRPAVELWVPRVILGYAAEPEVATSFRLMPAYAAELLLGAAQAGEVVRQGPHNYSRSSVHYFSRIAAGEIIVRGNKS